MNILIYNTSFFELSETFIQNQVSALLDNGNNVTLAAHNFKNIDSFSFKNKVLLNSIPITISQRIFHFINRTFSNNDFLLPQKSINELKKILFQNNIEVIHAHFGNNAIRIMPIAKKLNIPLIISFHGYDASQLLKEKKYTILLPELFSYASQTILCANYMVNKLTPYGLEMNKTSIIHYGVDLDKINSIKTSNDNSTIKIIHAGRLTEKKGVPDLIKVVIKIQKELPKLNLLLEIIGDGEELPLIQSIIKKKNAQSYIKLLGAKPHLELLTKVKDADIFVLNSRVDSKGDAEGFPNAILEAMAAKTCVVSTNHAGIPEIIKNMETGILIEECDNNALKDVLIKLILNTELRTKLADNALLSVKDKFSLRKMNLNLTSLFNKD